MIAAIVFGFAVLLALLTLTSYVDRLYAELGKFLAREFQQNIDNFERDIEPRLGVTRDRAALAMAVLVPMIMAAIAMLVGFVTFRDGVSSVREVFQATLSLALIVVVFNRFIPYVLFSRTGGRWLNSYTVLLRVLIYAALPLTLVLGFLQSVVSLTKQGSETKPDTQAQAVDALIEAGKEEGILDESNRELIQSVVEFGETTVREAMKPRPDIFAVSSKITVEQLVAMLKSKPFSRVPVYEESIHNVIGIVHAQDVLQVPDAEAAIRTVDSVMRRDVYFIPEGKLGSDLLREMQKGNIRMAIVIDEYGGTAGVVTIEDLIEEIVGEIGDEHDKTEVVKEGDSSYVVSGNVDVDRLDDLFGIRLESGESATVAGLVTDLVGRIPHRGEVVEEGGLKFEVLDSNGRRIERLRVSLANLNPEIKAV